MNTLWIETSHIRKDVVFVFGLLLAAAVTVHVLLRKREVSAAAGWIGLAWFAPITGAILYFVFGVNRVERRARKLRPAGQRRSGRGDWPRPEEDADHFDPLERGIGRITGLPMAAGNALAIYHNGDEAYPPMLDAIGAATRSVALASYIFDADSAGDRFIAALTAAKERGVEVRVLIDGVGGGYVLSRAFHKLHAAGVPVERFMHTTVPWRMPFLNLRNHKKLLIVDGTLAFTGGMNISADNVMASHPADPVQDTHFRVSGPVVQQLMETFAQDWNFARPAEELDDGAWFPDIAPAGDTPARVIEAGPDNDVEEIEFAVLQAVACARDTIQVMTPYFLPDERLLTALALAAMRGVAVDILVPQKSDHRMVDWASRGDMGPMMTHGVRVWQCPPPFRHSKAMVVDGEWCLIGSSNWDMRSFRLNFEMCLEVYDRELAATLTALMTDSRGPQLTSEMIAARPVPVQLRDAAVRLLLPYL